MQTNEIQELLAQKAELDAVIEAKRSEARAAAVAQVKAIMAEAGITAADLGIRGDTISAPKAPRTRAAAGSVAAKFRDPQTGKTWAGRGRQPEWFSAAMAAGRSKAEFAIHANGAG